MYYKQIEILKHLIKRGDLPENVDWIEIYKYWLHRDNIKTKVKRVYSLIDRYRQRASTMNHRARKAGVAGSISYQELTDIMRASNDRCKKCGKHNDLVFDHIIPMYHGGSNIVDNLQVLCRLCNMEKGVSN